MIKAESVVKKAATMLSESERFELKRNIINQYKALAEKAARSGKNGEVVRVYEKLLPYLVDDERTEVKRKMAESYKKLGRIRESIEMEKDLERAGPAKPTTRKYFEF